LDIGGFPATVTGAVRVNQRRDGVSPVVASIYCSPHPAALQIDPPPGSGNFASMILRPENCFANMMATCFNRQRSEKTYIEKTKTK
jgi:hypothetical protein